MTNDEIRIKVAEAMGYHTLMKLETPACHGWFAIPPGKVLSDLIRVPLPDYPEDLNACSTFEATLTDEEWKDYGVPLGSRDIGWGGAKKLLSATARQRCIAYLKVKGILP